jgi:ubiquinone/menaquinone biosynthesis C-methylase UbiE
MSKYLMENKKETHRLEMKTNEAESILQLKRVGLRKNMKTIDIGCGTGAVTRTIAKIVKPAKVIGIDFSAERLEAARRLARAAGIKNIEFKLCDLGDKESVFSVVPKNGFDFVWSRFLFEYLKNPQDVLYILKNLAKPNGKVVVADLDGHQAAFLYPVNKRLQDNMDKIFLELPQHGFDPFVGRKLYHMFYKAGFKGIKAHILPYQIVAGKVSSDVLENWKIKFATLRPVFLQILKSQRAVKKTTQSFIKSLQSKDSFSFSLLFIVEGRK